ncbi:MAG: hypothetical protein IPN76_16835 [Saprospiraceae bacterium]|nr:hypothetical protein [Saprospiraceae bacterium]
MTVLIFCFFVQNSYSQLGLSFGRKTFNAKGWEERFGRNSIYLNPYPMIGWQVGADYHLFGARRKRIEFLPSISLSRFKFEESDIATIKHEVIKLEHLQSKLQINIRFYIFDMNCDYYCDSLNTKESFLRKSFFLETSPMLALNFNYQFYNSNARAFGWHNSKSTTVGAMIGVGIDLHVNEKWAITPIYQFHYFPWNSRWSDGKWIPYNIKSDLKQHYIGCRIQVEL